MHPNLIQRLEELGFIKDTDPEKCFSLPAKAFNNIYTQVWDSIFRTQYEGVSCNAPPSTGFNFLASSEMRGDLCDECRPARIQFLSRFAALYADELIVPLPLQRRSKVSLSEARDDLYTSISTILQLRPVVESGNVIPAVMSSNHCPEHKPWVAEIIEFTYELSEAVFTHRLRDFKFDYEGSALSPNGKPSVYIKGPSGFFFDGEGVVITYQRVPGWAKKTWEKSKKLIRLTPKEAAKTGLLQKWFFDTASDTTFQMAYGRQKNARYLTSSQGETVLLDWFTDDEPLRRSNANAAALLTHELPFGDVSIRRLLKVRNDEKELFTRYRDAINTISNDFLLKRKQMSRRDAREIVYGQIEPALRRLRGEISLKRKSQATQAALGGLVLAAGAVLGAFGIPIREMTAAASVGGLLVGNAVKERTSERSNIGTDFYYLLKIPAPH